MPVTIRDVARRARVAVGTVSRVVNNHPDVNPKLREKVERVLAELNYRPNARARSFARNSSPIVSFILSNRDFLHPFHSHVLQGVEEYCEEAGYFVIYTRFRYSPDIPAGGIRLPGVLQSHGIADCIILAGTNYENFTSALEKRGVHYVLLANNYVAQRRRDPLDQVRFDDFTGAVEATRYLVQLGHKEIWYVGDTSLPWYRTRHEGYATAMAEAGLKARAQTLGLSDERFKNGFNSAGIILEQKAPVTAIFAGTDDVAYGAWEGLRLHGLEVPRDISLIGFDDQSAQMRMPLLTSVRVEAEEVGRQLAKMAIAKIQSKGLCSPEVVVPTRLIKRETCRPLFTLAEKEKA
jgi:DNA-binding LacI/PurR family transcriptional regulator